MVTYESVNRFYDEWSQAVLSDDQLMIQSISKRYPSEFLSFLLAGKEVYNSLSLGKGNFWDSELSTKTIKRRKKKN